MSLEAAAASPTTHRRRALVLVCCAWLTLLVAAVAVLERPTPLVVNLGPGDGFFARGFRPWEREGAAYQTIYRWTLDGSRVDIPFDVRSGTLTARLRVGRFVEPPQAVTLRVGGQVVDRWTQPHGGWSVRRVDLGPLRGPLSLQFRSDETRDELGVTLDWIEVVGAGLVVPRPSVLARAGALLLGVPLLLLAAQRRGLPAAGLGCALAGLAAAAIAIDRLGGFMAVAEAGLPALVVAVLLLALAAAIRGAWPDTIEPIAQWVPLVALFVALVALAHPSYYYPDVDTHARFLAAIRADPHLAWDPAPFQRTVGTWMRRIGGERVAFPYSPVFHLLAWPLAVLFDEVCAVKALAALAFATTLILTFVLARALGLERCEAVLAQGLVVLLPVTASRLSLALYPTLMGQALDLWVVVWLARRFEDIGEARVLGATLALLLAVQCAYTGSLYNVGLVLGLFALRQWAAGDRVRAVRLAIAYALAAAVVLVVLYGRFLPTLVRDVLPHAAERAADVSDDEAAAAPGVLATAAARALLFYGWLYPPLLVAGATALRRSPETARRATAAALAAGALLLLLRGALPGLFRDAKEVELLAAPAAVVGAAGLGWISRRGTAGRVAAVLAVLVLAAWGAERAAHVYGALFVARGL